MVDPGFKDKTLYIYMDANNHVYMHVTTIDGYMFICLNQLCAVYLNTGGTFFSCLTLHNFNRKIIITVF